MESTRREAPDAVRQQPAVQRQSTVDFFDSSLEWRRVFAETWGSFLLVLVAAGGGVVAAMSGGRVTLSMMVVAPGLMVMAIIYFMGTVSGAHLNPAVTLAFAVQRNFPRNRVPAAYVVAQVVGGCWCGCFSSGHVRYGWRTRRDTAWFWCDQRKSSGDGSGAHGRAGEHDSGNRVGCPEHRHERRHRRRRYIALAGLWSAPVTGASMNPARSLGPDLVRGDLHTTWIYIVGPVIGALIGVGVRVDSEGEAYSGWQDRRAGRT